MFEEDYKDASTDDKQYSFSNQGLSIAVSNIRSNENFHPKRKSYKCFDKINRFFLTRVPFIYITRDKNVDKKFSSLECDYKA